MTNNGLQGEGKSTTNTWTAPQTRNAQRHAPQQNSVMGTVPTTTTQTRTTPTNPKNGPDKTTKPRSRMCTTELIQPTFAAVYRVCRVWNENDHDNMRTAERENILYTSY